MKGVLMHQQGNRSGFWQWALGFMARQWTLRFRPGSGNTPLHHLLVFGKPVCVSHLTSFSASLAAEDEQGYQHAS
jgi:hypothetical protein